LGRAIEAGQRLVADRMDLARLDIAQVLNRVSRSALFVAAGAFLACVGWVGLMVAAGLFGTYYVSAAVSAGLVGVFNVAIGGALIGIGMQRARYETTREQTAREQTAREQTTREHGNQRGNGA
jgi:hypothetical protein